MDAFERFVAVALEADGFDVFEDVRFCVEEEDGDAPGSDGPATRGCEVAIVGTRPDRLVLAVVRSMFGSRGVAAEHVTGQTRDVRCRRRYELLNDRAVRAAVVADAGKRFGYDEADVGLRFYVAKFASHGHGDHEARVREWCSLQQAGSGPIDVIDVKQVLEQVREAARRDDRDDPVLKTLEFLDVAGFLTLAPQ